MLNSFLSPLYLRSFQMCISTTGQDPAPVPWGCGDFFSRRLPALHTAITILGTHTGKSHQALFKQKIIGLRLFQLQTSPPESCRFFNPLHQPQASVQHFPGTWHIWQSSQTNSKNWVFPSHRSNRIKLWHTFLRLSAVWIQPLPPGKQPFCLSWDRTFKPATSSFTKWVNSLLLPRLHLFPAGSSSPLCLKNLEVLFSCRSPPQGLFQEPCPNTSSPHSQSASHSWRAQESPAEWLLTRGEHALTTSISRARAVTTLGQGKRMTQVDNQRFEVNWLKMEV